MYLDEEQADAVLDVVQHTKEFVAVWNAEQRRGSTEAPQEIPKRKAISQAAYTVIMDKLLVSYAEATQLGVPDDLLLEVINKILPSDLEFTISIDHSYEVIMGFFRRFVICLFENGWRGLFRKQTKETKPDTYCEQCHNDNPDQTTLF